MSYLIINGGLSNSTFLLLNFSTTALRFSFINIFEKLLRLNIYNFIFSWVFKLANFKFVISEPETKKSFQTEVDQAKAIGIVGKKIGDDIDGDFLGLQGYSFKITGGTDKDGFPMHPSVKGQVRKKVLLSTPPGFHPKIKGQRKRKIVRGNTISTDIAQINLKIVKKGVKPLEEIIPTKKKVEKPKEEVKEVKKKPKEEEKEQPKAETELKETKKEETKKEVGETKEKS